jgi:hypothetical protein
MCFKRWWAGLAVTALLLVPKQASSDRIASGGCRLHGSGLLEQVTLEKYPDGPCSVPTVFMARSRTEWEALMKGMLDRGELVLQPAPPPPVVNWKRYGVIVVSLGRLPTNGYGVEIRSVKRLARTALLDIQITVPRSKYLPQVLTFPYHMIQVAKEGMNDVEICSRTFRFVGSEGRAHADLETSDEENDLTIPEFTRQLATWGGLKARF